jgi:hypothetical protein
MKTQNTQILFKWALSLVTLFALTGSLSAQSDSSSPSAARWGELEARSHDSVEKNAGQGIALADDFKRFYEENPSHAHALDARALEALNLLRAWRSGDMSQKNRRERAVAEVRSNSDVPIELRAQIAATTENTEIEKQSFESISDRIKAHASVALDLSKEFPEWGTGYESLIGIARVSEPADARRLLEGILNSANAPSALKSDARFSLDRLQLIGKNFEGMLRPQDKNVIRGLRPNGLLLVYSWSDENLASQKIATTFRENSNSDVQFLGIRLNSADAIKGARNQSLIDFLGASLSDDPKDGLSQSLKMDQPGMAYLVNEAGIIVAVAITPKIAEEFQLFSVPL